jgi:hypothetical protein
MEEFFKMADIIKIRRSLTASTVPAAASLSEGELAVNIVDKKLWIGDTAGDPVLLIDDAVQVINAADVVYDNSTSGLTATDVQAAIDEVLSDFSAHESDTSNPHSTSWSNLLNIPTEFPAEAHGHDGGTF